MSPYVAMAADPDGAVLVGDVLGLLDDRGAHGAGVLDAAVDVGHLQGDVDDAVAVRAVVVEQGAVRGDPALDDEAAGAAPEHERLVVAVAGLGAAVGDQLHPVGGLVVVRGLGGVADHEHQRVPPGHREGVLALVVRHQADELLELVEVEVGVALFGGQGDRVGHGCTVDHRASTGQPCADSGWSRCAICCTYPPHWAGHFAHDDRRPGRPAARPCSPSSRRSACWAPRGRSGWPAARCRPGSTGWSSAG